MDILKLLNANEIITQIINFLLLLFIRRRREIQFERAPKAEASGRTDPEAHGKP